MATISTIIISCMVIYTAFIAGEVKGKKDSRNE